jgi:putative ABC transport system substrate-binding protein
MPLDHLKRREFITLLCGAAAWPLAARAQQSAKVRRLGFLQPGAPPEPLIDVVRDRLRELGYAEGRDIILEVRWAEGKLDRLPALAAELVDLNVDVIVAFTTPSALAARNATKNIPIVFTAVGDPVGAGVVPSLARPGGNATGFSGLATELSGKRLEILRKIVPAMSRVAMLWNDTNPGMMLRAGQAQEAAAKLGVTVQSVGVHDLIDFEPAYAAIRSGGAEALLTLADGVTILHRKQIVEFASQQRLPAMYETRQFVQFGGLVSYGSNSLEIQRRAADYIDRIFKGTKPADLPVEQPTKFDLVLNLKTAKALGLEIPPTVLALADEVIE